MNIHKLLANFGANLWRCYKKFSGSYLEFKKEESVLNDIEYLKDNFFYFDESVQIPFLSNLYLQIFGEKTDGLCVEVGAFDGKTCSNSLGLAQRGWRCFLIEPVKEFAELAILEHQGRENVTVCNAAIYSSKTELSIFVAGPLSTSSPELYTEYSNLNWAKGNLPIAPRERIVQAVTLDQFIENHCPSRKIDVLIIDVEGAEIEVMSGFDLHRHKPRMVIIELTDFHPDLQCSKKVAREIYEKFLEENYVVVYKDAINTCFLSKEEWLKLKV